MVFNPRQGIRAKNVYISFIDAVRDGSNIALTNADFTGRPLERFWGAYYGDLALGGSNYYISDLGFDSTGASQTFGTQAYDTITGAVTAVVTLTTNTSMTVNAHAGEYVTIRKADGAKVFARIVSNTASALTLDRDVSVYTVASGDKIALLSVPCGLNMIAFQRLDHIATDFELTPPESSTEDQFFLGTSDSAGSQNLNIDELPPGKMTGSITVRGGVVDLMRLKYNQDSTVPTGTIRYNMGSETSENVGITCAWVSNVGDPDHADGIASYVICNNIKITNVGILDSVDSEGRAEATVEFEVEGSSVRVEKYSLQANNTSMNI